MPDQTTTCTRCARHPDLDYRRFIADLDLGHDPVAHRIYWRLHCVGVAVERLAELCDGEILDIRTLGAGALARIRTRFPGPPAPESRPVRPIEDLEDLLGCISLYVSWPYVTKQLTTEQKELFADAHDAWQARLHAGGPDAGELRGADRWWRE